MAIKFNKPVPKTGAVATTSIEMKKGKDSVAHHVEQETVEDAPAPKVLTAVQLPVVHFAAGYTHNLGDYQSARIDVGISIPTPMDEIDEVYNWAENWCNDRVKKCVDELTG